MNIHFTHDEKFINTSVATFEKYYPSQNIFFVQIPKTHKGQLQHVKAQENVIPFAFTRKDAVNKLLPYVQNGDNILIHFLNPIKAAVTLALKEKRNITIYWLFHGGDLYRMLQDNNIVHLFDNPRRNFQPQRRLKKYGKDLFFAFHYKQTQYQAKQKFFKILDYSCFWNPYDYDLFTKHFTTNAKFKEFCYFSHNLHQIQQLRIPKVPKAILINHSASMAGNHLTVLQKLNNLQVQQ